MKYRIVTQGGAYGGWWKIQRKRFFSWETLHEYIDDYEDAKSRVEKMKEWD